MAHSVVYMEAWVRWLLCNDIIPKAIPLSHFFERLCLSGAFHHVTLHTTRLQNECLLTRLATMLGMLHTKSLSEHSKQTGESVARESQWIMCTLSADS